MDRAVMAKIRLIVSDFLLAFMWVSSGALNKLFVNRVLGWGHEPRGEIMKATLSIINMFFFAFLGKISKGGAYNPLTVLAGAISGDFSRFLFTVGARIPAQVIGSITGVRLLIDTFPEVGFGPHLTVDIHHGNGMGLCSWGSYNQGAYTCLLACPNGGTLLAVWTFRLLVQPHKEEKEKMKAKSE